MKKTMERISLLSLSLMLISSFSITAGLPAMKPILANSDIQQARWNYWFPSQPLRS